MRDWHFLAKPSLRLGSTLSEEIGLDTASLTEFTPFLCLGVDKFFFETPASLSRKVNKFFSEPDRIPSRVIFPSKRRLRRRFDGRITSESQSSLTKKLG